MFTTTLLISLFVSPIDLAGKAIIDENYELASNLLSKYNPSPTNYNNYYYYSLICDFRLNKKDKVLDDLKKLDDSFNKFSQRQKALIFLISNDIKNWQADDLNDIQRDMIKSQNRLNNKNANQKTQEIQKEIIAKLDKFIQEIENPPQSKGSDGKDLGKTTKNSPSGQSDKPAQDSIIMGGDGKGKVDEKKLRYLAENWGSLPPEERARVTKELNRDVPAKYKDLVDAYIKSLNKINK